MIQLTDKWGKQVFLQPDLIESIEADGVGQVGGSKVTMASGTVHFVTMEPYPLAAMIGFSQ